MFLKDTSSSDYDGLVEIDGCGIASAAKNATWQLAPDKPNRRLKQVTQRLRGPVRRKIAHIVIKKLRDEMLEIPVPIEICEKSQYSLLVLSGGKDIPGTTRQFQYRTQIKIGAELLQEAPERASIHNIANFLRMKRNATGIKAFK